ncbi:ATP-binding protein [Deminuibacter soli]|uniref:ATP-binding protein n=1 Tax=Deminuibacter soli TaxID=2291815 RepID=A0A3E1NGI2_9BACT|nr:ATP-binding protein [Deminuibacter soli]RFM26934.1 ATP-binding protein [Deminuibacter soli]
MSTAQQLSWPEANQRYLMAAVQQIRLQLQLFYTPADDGETRLQQANEAVAQAQAQLPAPAALDVLCNKFNLSAFERSVLLLSAGAELDAGFALLLSQMEGDSARMLPSFGLALSVLGNAHWNALTPQAPLRYWRLIELLPSQLLTTSLLKIDEQVLHYLTGIPQLDERFTGVLDGLLIPVTEVPSQVALAQQARQLCMSRMVDGWPVMVLSGAQSGDKPAIAQAICSLMQLPLYQVVLQAVPTNAKDITEYTRLWNRTIALTNCALLVDMATADMNDKVKLQTINALISQVQGLVIVCSSQWKPAVRQQCLLFEVPRPSSAEQLTLWKDTLQPYTDTLNGELEKLVGQFSLDAQAIHSTGSQVLQQMAVYTATATAPDAAAISRVLWKSCAIHTRAPIHELAQRIEPAATWDDLVLPDIQKSMLRQMGEQVKQRAKVYQQWGFAAMASRGLGITSLFSGESGTGKTMAAEVLAGELQLDLFRIDLSQVVNKYIGETEKNLGRIFDAAEDSCAILLFDEADALFGKRSDIKDSHDRYSNIEVSYLLQRMEAYRGLAILTTNMRSALDKAFLRRIRFVVQFPFPDAAQRAEIWRRIFPAGTPTSDIDIARLSRLNMAGGNIRNIALNAAFMAAGENTSIQMPHLMHAAKNEYQKLEKIFSNSELNA